MISKELTILARVVQAKCYQPDYEILEAGGCRASTDAISALNEHGLIRDIEGVGRGIRAKWASEDWKHDDELSGSEPNPIILSCLCAMISQFIGGKDGAIEIRAGDHSAAFWKEVVEYLADVNIMRITRRFVDVATPRDISFLRRWGVVTGDKYEFDAVDAKFVDRRNYWPTQYPDFGWDKVLHT